MNNSFRDKIYNNEVTPPVRVWDRIAAELDETVSIKNLSDKLFLAEVIPPETTWSKIASELEESAIAAKLYNIEITPPATAWPKVQSAFNNEAAAIKPKKIIRFLRYAAAAALIGFISFSTIKILQDKSEETDISMKETVSPPHDNAPATLTNEKLNGLLDNIAAVSDDARNDAALEASKKTYARLDIPARNITRDISNFYFASGNIPTGTTRGLNIEATAPAEESLADRYITLITPEGNIIRMSKKLSDMICCISGEIDDQQCKDQLKKWREKIVASSLGHSSESFMDILYLVNSLQDNNHQ